MVPYIGRVSKAAGREGLAGLSKCMGKNIDVRPKDEDMVESPNEFVP